MLQICPNQTENKNKNFVNFMRVEGSIVDHAEVTIYKTSCDNKTYKKTVFVFSGYEYTISFYDNKDGCHKTITGLVQDICGDNNNCNSQSFILKHIKKPDCNNMAKDEFSVTKGPGCGCILNTPHTEKYNTVETISIPISNITNIEYVVGGRPNPPTPKKGVKVVLLGITAETVRAVIINLSFIDDQCDKAVKDVSLTIGNIYNIAYIDTKDKTIYEIEGRLVSIRETNIEGSNCSIIRTSEHVGMRNSIYTSKCDCNTTSDRDKYMCGENIENDIALTFDVSTDFSGDYQIIMLSSIRDCTLISENTDNENTTDSENDSDIIKQNCDCCTRKIIEIESGDMKYFIDPKTKEIKVEGSDTLDSISIKEVIDFYFGN